jgi:N-acetylglucosaminyl-diphospho-decaprenol L-rhamnosyltransferase
MVVVNPRVGATTGVVVVAHESGHQLEGLLDSLADVAPHLPVHVVDNASYEAVAITDSPRQLRVSMERSPINVGYGAAVNRGVAALLDQHALEFVALINPDVRLTGDTVTELVDHLQRMPRVGAAVGPAVDDTGEPVPTAWAPPGFSRAAWYASGLRSPRLRNALSRMSRSGEASRQTMGQKPFRVDGHALGGALVLRVSAFGAVSGFDEGYFLYWEDADLAARMRSAGYETWYFPVTPVRHGGGQSSKGVDRAFRHAWYLHSADRYAATHLSPWQRRRLKWGFRIGGTAGAAARLAGGRRA